MRGLPVARRRRLLSRRGLFVALWLPPVWIGLGLASLAIGALPFKRIAPLLGVHHGTEKPGRAATPAQEAAALKISRTIRLAARHAPWRSDCYPQAIVARLMLGLHRLPCTVSMGVRRSPASGRLEAHAWVESGAIRVTGGDGAEYSAVAVFADGRRV